MPYLDLEAQLLSGTINTRIESDKEEMTRMELETILAEKLQEILKVDNFSCDGHTINIRFKGAGEINVSMSREDAVHIGIDDETFDDAYGNHQEIENAVLDDEIKYMKKVYVLAGDIFVHEPALKPKL